jgi:hypothetical protein
MVMALGGEKNIVGSFLMGAQVQGIMTEPRTNT